MSCEPEDDNVADQPLTPTEWTCWVLLGDQHVNHMPIPLVPLANRIVLAIRQAIKSDRSSCRGRDCAAKVAVGQTDAEYATVILELCGVSENWSMASSGQWESSMPNLRQELEALVRLIKTRTVKNVNDHQRMAQSDIMVDKFLMGITK